MPEVVFDSCVISNFAITDSLWILKRLYEGRGYLTDFVYAEIVRGIQSGNEKLEAVSFALRDGWLKEAALKGKEEKILFEKLSLSLGAGEASCIAIAGKRGYVFASDDKTARNEASILNVSLTGTIGIIYRAVKKNVIGLNKGNELLREMIKCGFYSPVKSLGEIEK
jgi:predicted nucleic acid-binding protein